jgi:hypothetical protein
MASRPLAVLVVLTAACSLRADEPKLPDAKAFDKLVVDTLRDVHNKGADLYNTKKEFEGTYRMYQGALLAVKPLLGHRPAAQKIIDDGFAAAEKEANVAQKAFKMHEAIEAVRALLKEGGSAKKPEDAKPKEKNPVAAGGGPGFRGRVTLKGQPLAGGEITFVSLDQPKPRVFSAKIQDDGQYAPAEVVPPGKYVVIVTGKGVPEKFQLTTTSGLVIEVTPPPSVRDFDLQ